MKIIFAILFCLGSLLLNGQTACTIKKDTDKFTGAVSITTQLASNAGVNPIIFAKQIKGSDTLYFLHLYLYKNYGSYAAKGAYVIFEDSIKWQKPEAKIKVEYIGSNTYSYEVYVPISFDDAIRLTEKRITDIKIYDAIATIKKESGDYFICATKKAMED